MKILGVRKLEKLKAKNRSNVKLAKAIDKLIYDLNNATVHNFHELREVRKDADLVHSEGFYFFNIYIHRTLMLLELEEDGEATVIWVGDHQEYERIFKNNKDTIEKWLRTNEYL